MTKKERIYKILAVMSMLCMMIMISVFAVWATQKSMKLKLSFNVDPQIKCEIYIIKYGETDEKIIFSNTTTGAQGKQVLGAGVLLNANTLTLSETFTGTYGANFTLVIYNHNDFDIKITASGDGTTTTTATANGGAITQLAIATTGGVVVLTAEQWVPTYTVSCTVHDYGGSLELVDLGNILPVGELPYVIEYCVNERRGYDAYEFYITNIVGLSGDGYSVTYNNIVESGIPYRNTFYITITDWDAVTANISFDLFTGSGGAILID